MFEFLDALLGSVQAEDALNTGRCLCWRQHLDSHSQWHQCQRAARELRTFFLQEDTAFCHHYRDVAVDVALSIIVDEGDRNVRVCDALAQRDAENAMSNRFWTK